MKILVTGALGFVGRNLTANLKNIRDGKNRTRPQLKIDAVYEYDLTSTPEELDEACRQCDFVFNLAGVNRPKDPGEFMKGNYGFGDTLLKKLSEYRNRCPIMLASSIQATLTGRFGNSEYGRSKKAGEELLFAYGERTGADVYVYRFPNLAGKWCRPNYNSAVATFCHNIARDLPVTVNDPSVELELLFIDDLIEEMLDLLEGHPHRCDFDGLNAVMNENGQYCWAPVTHKATLGYIVSCLESFRESSETLTMPYAPDGSFEKKLFSMYLSYLPPEKAVYDLATKADARGSFTELVKTIGGGQFSVNISKPGVTKGQHWHNSKWELFIVVSGKALIQQRRIGDTNPEDVVEFRVDGDRIRAVRMLPGYTHNIINLSDTEDLVTLMWANECFNPEKPDTFFEPVGLD